MNYDGLPHPNTAGVQLYRTFGQREMELAAQRFVEAAVERGAWDVTLDPATFAGYLEHWGMVDLRHAGWLVRVPDGLMPSRDFVERVCATGPLLDDPRTYTERERKLAIRMGKAPA